LREEPKRREIREEAKPMAKPKSDKVRIAVSGYVEVKRSDLNEILKYDDPFAGLIQGMAMGFVNVDNLEFDLEE
jgi:hypothetical protein